jgi:tetratricopeptide (TPR) repeat protein
VSISNFIVGQQSILRGVVCDPEGAPLKNAKITFRDPSRGTTFTFKSDKEGKFIKIGIPPSLYLVRVELDAYFPFKTRFRVRLGMEESLEIRLKKIPPKIDEDKNLAEGIDFFKQGKYKEAINSFEKVTYRFPENFQAFYNLGLSHLRSGDIDEAIISLEKVIELKPDLVEAYFALGECYFNKEDNDKAMAAFSKASELQPDNAKAYYNLGIIYYKYNKTEEALSSFDKSIELNPEFSSVYYQAGLASIKMGDFENAIKFFEEFLRLEPGASESTQVKAMIEELKKK